MELSLKSLLLQTLWSMVTDQGRKTFYKLISATILMENMLKIHEEQGGTITWMEQYVYKYNQG
jgi:hypothetical protein